MRRITLGGVSITTAATHVRVLCMRCCNEIMNLRKRVKSELDFVQNELKIHCTEDGEKINMNIEVRNIFFLIQFNVPFKIISAHMRRANQ